MEIALSLMASVLVIVLFSGCENNSDQGRRKTGVHGDVGLGVTSEAPHGQLHDDNQMMLER